MLISSLIVYVTLTNLLNLSWVETHNYIIIFLYLLKSFDLMFKNNAVYFVNLWFSPIIFNVLNTYKYIVNRCKIFYSCPAVIFKW